MTERLPPVPLATLKAVLGRHGAAPRKRHGQHFLQDDNLLAAIVRDAGPRAGDTVVEVGPGPGLLTRHLLASGARVLAIEIDVAMRAVAGDLIEPELQGRLEWTEGDAMAGQRRLAPATQAALARSRLLVANLPYNIAGALLGAVVGAEPPGPQRIVVTIQREVADRLVARPGQRAYGPLAVLMALFARVERLRSIGPTAFWPAPKVSSAVVGLDRVARRPQELAIPALEAFLAAAFHQRRKILVNSVASATGRRPADVLETLELPQNRQNWRAEAFDEIQFYDLAVRWARRAQGERSRPDPS